MTRDDVVVESTGRLVVAFFVGRDVMRAGPAARYGAGLYTDGSTAGYTAARERLLRAAEFTMKLLAGEETGPWQEAFAYWACWSHPCLLEPDRYRMDGVDGPRP